MKFLHTSDWHLGRTLYGHSRYNEFTAFLDWLHALIETEKVEMYQAVLNAHPFKSLYLKLKVNWRSII